MHEVITLDNSLRIILEQIPHVKSVTTGVWVGAGSVMETHENNGVSHFIEHMMFKGTKNRTARQIAECIDDIGGQINAFTGRECTCYYAKTLNSHVHLSIDLLADMLFNALFDENDIATEKGVVLEEISMYEDSPEELVHDLLMETVWPGTSLGHPILGSAESLKNITAKTIKQYMGYAYTPQNSVVAVVGDFDRQAVLDQIKYLFGNWEAKQQLHTPIRKVPFANNTAIMSKEIEQAHICIGYDALARGHNGLYDLMVVNTVFGSGMSSRLFQKIRENRGLVYSIYSYNSAFNSAGVFGIYAGANPANLDNVISLISSEIKLLKEHFLSETEILKSKEQLKSSLILGLESTSSRMSSYGKAMLLQNKIKTMDEMIHRLDEVSYNSIAEIIEHVFSKEPSFAVVGGVSDKLELVV